MECFHSPHKKGGRTHPNRLFFLIALRPIFTELMIIFRFQIQTSKLKENFNYQIQKNAWLGSIGIFDLLCSIGTYLDLEFPQMISIKK